MAQVYCVKCKQKTEQQNSQQITMKNGKPAQQGNCTVCGTKTTLILPKVQAQA
jgi:NAD-dependent SIR2 family protein deacetylase